MNLRTCEVEVDAPEGKLLRGTLTEVERPAGLVVFAHGAGSSRHSPRNQAVARALNEEGLSTLLFDLLTEDEEAREQVGAMLRFDMHTMAVRLAHVVSWGKKESGLPIGLFGSSTGGGAALIVAARMPDDVQSVVSRGGRPDLAGDDLPDVACPVLLIVGEADPAVLDLNRGAQERLTTTSRLHVVPRATHLFEERGALDEVATVAGAFFVATLTQVQARAP